MFINFPSILNVKLHDAVFYGSLVVFPFVETVWELYLHFRQLRVVEESTELPDEIRGVISGEAYNLSRLYTLDKLQFHIVVSIFGLLNAIASFGPVSLYGHWQNAMIFAVSLGYSYENEIAVSLSFIFLISYMSAIIDIPFSLYYTFVIEGRYGFNKQNLAQFFLDRIKSFIITQMIILPLTAGMIYVIKYGGTYFFFYLWIFSSLATLAMISIYPTYIHPLFYNMKPLPPGNLKNIIEELAASQGFPLSKLFLVEESQRSTHSNAYFTGICGSIQIVLYDTLIYKKDPITGKETGMSDYEILAVIGHEIGHWKHGHIQLRLAIALLQLLGSYTIYAQLIVYDPLYENVGFPPGLKPVLIGLLAVELLLAPLNTIGGYLMTFMSRRCEYQADEFAVRLGLGSHLKKALCTLHKDNMSYPINDWLFSLWYRDHPSLIERINYINFIERNMR